MASALSASAPRPTLGTRVLCERYSGVPAGFGRDPHAGMVWIGGGELTPGSDQGYAEERGGTAQSVSGFWIDRTEVTVAQYAQFVAATGHVTQAEHEGEAPVFEAPSGGEAPDYSWWKLTRGANFRQPAGPGAGSSERPNHPAVQVSYADALAYAQWLGHALPSELQWEHAAKAGQRGAVLHREPRDARGKLTANFWQGEFPTRNLREDGFERSAPVGCFAPNPWGLFDMLGNVWEWTDSRYTSSHRPQDAVPLACEADPAAGSDEHAGCAVNPTHAGDRMTLKGGSFLCAANFCARYRLAARHSQEADQPAMHIGFRTVAP
jgi:formylglycine-generating enzyme required for sulfatase activity